MNITDTYSDVTGTSSQTVNLVNYAKNLDHSFLCSDYVVFCDQQYSYYIVWAENLELQNNKVVGNDIQYIRYYRILNDYSSSYKYVTGNDTSFSLNYDTLVTSNIEKVGFSCPTFDTYQHQSNLLDLCIFALACLFVIALTSFRKVVSNK